MLGLRLSTWVSGVPRGAPPAFRAGDPCGSPVYERSAVGDARASRADRRFASKAASMIHSAGEWASGFGAGFWRGVFTSAVRVLVCAWWLCRYPGRRDPNSSVVARRATVSGLGSRRDSSVDSAVLRVLSSDGRDRLNSNTVQTAEYSRTAVRITPNLAKFVGTRRRRRQS